MSQPHPNPDHTTPAGLGGQPAAHQALRRRNGHTPHRSCQGQAFLVFLQTPPPCALGLVCPSLRKRTLRQKEVKRTCPRPHCRQEEESGFEPRPPDSSPLSPLPCQAGTKMRNPPGHDAEKQGPAGTVNAPVLARWAPLGASLPLAGPQTPHLQNESGTDCWTCWTGSLFSPGPASQRASWQPHSYSPVCCGARVQPTVRSAERQGCSREQRGKEIRTRWAPCRLLIPPCLPALLQPGA